MSTETAPNTENKTLRHPTPLHLQQYPENMMELPMASEPGEVKWSDSLVITDEPPLICMTYRASNRLITRFFPNTPEQAGRVLDMFSKFPRENRIDLRFAKINSLLQVEFLMPLLDNEDIREIK